jgi:aquaporin Z
MKKYVVEFIGTFFLVFVVVMTGNPLAIGAVLMVMVYAGGHISGAHYNPAVTLAVSIRKKISPAEAAAYMIVQIVGGFVAAFIAFYFLHPDFKAPSPMPNINLLKPAFIEMLFTFALAYVVLNVATHSKTAGNSFYGLAIGFTITAAAFTGGGISGGAFNPAVGIGPILVDTFWNHGNSLAHAWLYVLCPFLGATVAGILFNWLNPEE